MSDDRIEVRCTVCAKKLNAPARMAGRCFNCPECGERLVVPARVGLPATKIRQRAVIKGDQPPLPAVLRMGTPPTPPTLVQPEPAASPTPQRRFRLELQPYTATLLLIGFGLTLWGLALWPVGYAGIGIFMLGCTIVAAKSSGSQWAYPIGAVVLCICLMAWAYNDTYQVERVLAEIRIVQEKRRLTGGVANTRAYIYKTPLGALTQDTRELLYSSSGKLTDTGMMHGRWESFSYSQGIERTYEYYWYGDPVTEGEWVLRNRGSR